MPHDLLGDLAPPTKVKLLLVSIARRGDGSRQPGAAPVPQPIRYARVAKQHIVCALMQGPESHYAECEKIARQIYKPVMRAHRCTVEQLAILEPALSETVGATFVLALREATDEAVRRGVPKQATVDFIIGHLNIELAIAFGIFPEGKSSDGALQAIEKARPVVFRDG